MKFSVLLQVIKDALFAFKMTYFSSRRDHYGYIDPSAKVFQPFIGEKGNVYLYKNTNINEYCKICGTKGKFIMRDYSGAAQGLTVITSNHVTPIGEDTKYSQNEIADDVVVDEDIWIGANVTLLPGVHLKRGMIVGAGSVCRKGIFPEYSIVVGNPAKIVGFRFTPEEIIKHEMIRYTPENRIPFQKLENNYNKYFINRYEDIKKILSTK